MIDILAGIWSKAWPILLGILFFGFIIIIHELGHFSFAKLFKVKINEFSIGMGPALFNRERNSTRYSLRLLPFGGYVSMEGEDEGSQDENAFCNKSVWKRIIIVIAGAAMNIILGFLLFAILQGSQELVGTTTVVQFSEKAQSCNYGLEVGDKIVKVDNTRVFTNTDLSYCLTRGDDNKVDLTVIRDGEKLLLSDVVFPQEEYEGRTFMTRDFWLLGKEKNVFNVIGSAVLETIANENMVRLSLVDMITGKYGIKDMSGPIGTMEIIADAATEAVSGDKEKRGDAVYYLIFIMAFITVNIGVVNLLPIPALDGGRLIFLVLEAIRRKPLLPKYEKYVHAVGLVLLLALIAIVTIKDVVYLFR